MSSKLSIDQMVRYLPELPSPTQRIALKYHCKELLFGGRAGGGKSSALLMAALQGITIPNYSAILFRRTYQDLALSGALIDRSHKWWDSTDAHWIEKDKTWTFPTGARISFGYLENSNDHIRYQSAEYQFVGFDEASQFAEKQILYLLSRLRAAPSFPAWLPLRLFLCSNPGGIGHEFLMKRYCIPPDGCDVPIEQRNKDGRLIRAFIPSLPSGNPGLNVKEYTDNLNLLDPITRDQLLHGKWVQDGSGLVYYCYQPETNNLITLPTSIPKSEWRYVIGMDFGATNDKTAFAICAYSIYEPTVYLVWCEEHSRMSPSDAARRYLELEEQFGTFEAVVGDCTPGYVSEMQKHFAIPIVNAEKQHKIAFINLFNGALANCSLMVLPAYCFPWAKQVSALQWSDNTHLKERQSQHNDSCDAALYAWRACRHYVTHDREIPKSDDEYEEYLLGQAEKKIWDNGVGLW